MAKTCTSQRLKSVPLFASLSKKELDLLVRQADHLRYPARYRVVAEGAPGEEFWLVVDGELAVHRGGRRGRHPRPGRLLRRAGGHRPRAAGRDRHRDDAGRAAGHRPAPVLGHRRRAAPP